MRKKSRNIEGEEVLRNAKELQEQIRLTRLQFDQALEPELIEAYVYELNALQAKYNYFLRLAREMELQQSYAEVYRPAEVVKQ